MNERGATNTKNEKGILGFVFDGHSGKQASKNCLEFMKKEIKKLNSELKEEKEDEAKKEALNPKPKSKVAYPSLTKKVKEMLNHGSRD